MRITEDWLRAHGTAKVGWTAAQLHVLNVGWPPTRGWLHRLVGTRISEAQQIAFEALGAARQQKLSCKNLPSR